MERGESPTSESGVFWYVGIEEVTGEADEVLADDTRWSEAAEELSFFTLRLWPGVVVSSGSGSSAGVALDRPAVP